jgi:outer membrane murein-binding lipoprotein Lpp
MPRETSRQKVDKLVADVIDLATEIARSLERAVRAMESRDAKVVEPGLEGS